MYRLDVRKFSGTIGKYKVMIEQSSNYRSLACVKNDNSNTSDFNVRTAIGLKNKWQRTENHVISPKYRCFSCSYNRNVNKSPVWSRYKSGAKEKTFSRDEKGKRNKKSGGTALPIAAQMLYNVNERGERNDSEGNQTGYGRV